VTAEAVVEETMQPTHGYGLRPPEQIGKQSAAWINTPSASPREKMKKCSRGVQPALLFYVIVF